MSQDFKSFELIVDDDGSTDDSVEKINDFEDDRIILQRQSNQGIAAAINLGLAVARGDLIAWIDSDDEWLPELLSHQVAILDGDPAIGVVYAKAIVIDEAGLPNGDVFGGRLRYPADPLLSILYNDPVCNITAVHRRECFERAGPMDPQLTMASDWELHLRMALTSGYRFNDRVLAKVRRHSSNTTADPSEVVKHQIRALDIFFARSDLPSRAHETRPAAFSNVYADAGFHCWYSGRKLDALALLASALRASSRPLHAAARIAWFTLAPRALIQRGQRLRSPDH